MKRRRIKNAVPELRCAIYTRVSTNEQADQEYSSIDAQRETGEAYVASQKHSGWRCLDDRYDDGGFSGTNTDRPAFQRLIADVEAGKVDVIICYKLDRLTRSLLDFARTLDVLSRHNVALVSVTQAFDTSSATGKLMMHILMSFAEFERSLISERTRDKIAAARRKGKYIGGRAVLGYNVVDRKLVVNELEAERVRQIFAIYLEEKSLLATAREINKRGWRTKSWRTRKGELQPSLEFNKTRLHTLLTNVVYAGKVGYRDEVHGGEHDGIVPTKTFDAVQKLLSHNGNGGGARNKYGALLQGILRCKACGCAMGHTYTARGNRRYRYYVCQHAQKNGWEACPSPSIPAPSIEQFVIDELRAFGQDPAIVAATLAHSRRLAEEGMTRLVDEENALKRQLRADSRELGRLPVAPDQARRSAPGS